MFSNTFSYDLQEQSDPRTRQQYIQVQQEDNTA